jgi:16S rRNA (uracil1498-N3)-methyltransferase
MQLPFFYEENLPDSNQFILSEDTARHIVQVLRMKEGEQVMITNGKGQTLTAEIVLADKKKTEVKIKNKEFVCQPQPKISIAISLIKNANRFEWFLEKATEIGVSSIIPLLCKRTEKTHFREERMRTILISAMLQSRQVWLPELSVSKKINEFLKNDLQYDQKFIAHCLEEEKKELKDFKLNNSSSKIILIGPEGDFTKEEIDLALENNYIPVSLGETRLRTETAGMVAAVLLK